MIGRRGFFGILGLLGMTGLAKTTRATDFPINQYGVVNPDFYEGDIGQKINTAQIENFWRPLKLVVPLTGEARIFEETICLTSEVTIDFQDEFLIYRGSGHAITTGVIGRDWDKIYPINTGSQFPCLRTSVYNLNLRCDSVIEKDLVQLMGFRSGHFQGRISKNVKPARRNKALFKLRSGDNPLGCHYNTIKLDLYGNRMIDEGLHVVSSGDQLCNANFISVNGSLFDDAIVWIEHGVGNMVRDCVWEQSGVGIRDQGRNTLVDWHSIYHEQLGKVLIRQQ